MTFDPMRWRGRATHVSARSLILSTLITGLDGRSNFERNGGALAPSSTFPSPTFSTTASRVRGLIDACEMMVNSGKACLAAESFLDLNMTIPTEPIGSIPRPQKVITAFEQYERGSLSREEFESIGSEAVRETIEKFEATGSPVITDGEQTKPSFATYPIHGLSNLNPDGVKIQFADGHVRQLPKLSSGPFRYKTYASSYLQAAKKFTRIPIKQAVISPSALSLLYPSDGIPNYPQEKFIEDLVKESVTDIRGCLDHGAHCVQIDFTEGRLAVKLDPSGQLLSSFIALINRVLDQSRLGLRVCGLITLSIAGKSLARCRNCRAINASSARSSLALTVAGTRSNRVAVDPRRGNRSPICANGSNRSTERCVGDNPGAVELRFIVHPSLRVTEMRASVADSMTWPRRPELGQEFGDVAALRRKRLRAPAVLRIVAQQVAVLFHIRAAARGIDDHRVRLGVFERVNCLTRELQDQHTARVSKQVKSRFSPRRRRSPPDSSGLPGARAAA